MRAIITTAFAVLLMGAGEGEKQKPPFADGPEAKKEAPKPAFRNWTVVSEGFAFTVNFQPGIPDAKQMTEIVLMANQIPKTPHPRYGKRIPLKNARITVEMENPAGEVVGTFLAHSMPLSRGKYGFHFTPTQEGIYRMKIAGRTATGDELKARLKFPVQVWPLPKELEGTGADSGGASVRKVIRRPVSK